MTNREASSKKYAGSPKGRYTAQKAHAKARGLVFALSFDDWWGLWVASGRWEDRGKALGQYCMTRLGDEGGYTLGNVRISEVTVNLIEQISNGAHAAHKLTTKKIVAIWADADSGLLSQAKIAEKYSVNQSTVSRILHGQRGDAVILSELPPITKDG